jgi:(R,R)-butanediol dehydrogenase/meso-butanediol dehydrogenase/diacetyl reductase
MDARATSAVLGHEMSGRIVRGGPGVEGCRPGEAVTVMPLHRDDTCARPDGRATNTSAGASTSPASTPPARCSSAGPSAEPTYERANGSSWSAADPSVSPVGVLIALVARSAGADVRLVELSAHQRLLL